MTANILQDAKPKRSTEITVASILFFFLGIISPIFYIRTILEIQYGVTIFPSFFGLEGSPFYEMLGVGQVFTVLYIILAIVTVAEIPVGYWLWKSLKRGGMLGLILFPISMVLWIGFGIPGPIAIGVLSVALIRQGWRTLT